MKPLCDQAASPFLSMANPGPLALTLVKLASYRLSVPLEQNAITPPLPSPDVGMEWRLRTISDPTCLRPGRNLLPAMERKLSDPWVASLKCSVVQALHDPSIFIRAVFGMIISTFSPCLVLYSIDLIFTAAL